MFQILGEIEVLAPQVAGLDVEKAADLHLAAMRDEGERLAAQAAAHSTLPRAMSNVEWLRAAGRVRLRRCRPVHLPQNPVIVRRAGDADRHLRPFRLRREPLEDLFILPGGELLVPQLEAAAGRHEQEGIEERRAQPDREIEDRGQFGQVVPADGGIDLEFQAAAPRRLDPAQDGVERAGDAAEFVVRGRRRAVERERNAPDARFEDLRDGLVVQQRPARRHHHRQAESVRVSGDVVNVRAQHRLAAGEDDRRPAEGGDVVQERAAFREGQFAGVRALPGRRAAVLAVQEARARDLPGDEPRKMRATGCRIRLIAR